MSSPFSPVCDGCGAHLLEPVATRCPYCKHRHAGPTAPMRWAKAFVRLLPWILIFLAGVVIAFAISEFESRLLKGSQQAADEHRVAEQRRAATDSTGQAR